MRIISLISLIVSLNHIYCSTLYHSQLESDLNLHELTRRQNAPIDCPQPEYNCQCNPGFQCVLKGRTDSTCPKSECVRDPNAPPDSSHTLAIVLGVVFGILGFFLLSFSGFYWMKRKEIKEAGGFVKYLKQNRKWASPAAFTYKGINRSNSALSSYHTNNNSASRTPSVLLEAKPEKINFNNGLQAKVVDLDSNSRMQSMLATVTPQFVSSHTIPKSSPIEPNFSEIKTESEIHPATEFFSIHSDLLTPPHTPK